MSPSLVAPQVRQKCRGKNNVFGEGNYVFRLPKNNTIPDPCDCGCDVEEPHDLLKNAWATCKRHADGAFLGASEQNAFYDKNERIRANRKSNGKRSLNENNDNFKKFDKGANNGRGQGIKSQQKRALGKKGIDDVQSKNKGLVGLQKQYKDKRKKDNKRGSSHNGGKSDNNNSGNGVKGGNGNNKGSKSAKKNNKGRQSEKDKRNKGDKDDKSNKVGKGDKYGQSVKSAKDGKGVKSAKDGKVSLRALALERLPETDIRDSVANRGSTNTKNVNSKNKGLIHHREKSENSKNKGLIHHGEKSEYSKNKGLIHHGGKSKNTFNKKGRKGSSAGLKKGKRVSAGFSLPHRFDEIRTCDFMRVELEDRDLRKCICCCNTCTCCWPCYRYC